jgi:hypothetical protein
MPGDRSTLDGQILRQAAAAYEGLLARALNDRAGDPQHRIASLIAALERLGPSKGQWLCHPLFIEGLHTVKLPTFRRWHTSVASPSALTVFESGADRGDLLGNSLLALALCNDPSWNGEEYLATDLAGRIRFPSCDWSIVVYSDEAGPQNALVSKTVRALLDEEEASLSLDEGREPFLVLTRENALRMISHNAKNIRLQQMVTPHAEVRARLQYEIAICSGNVRYDPIYFVDFERHAGCTGAIVECILDTLRCNSPAIHSEFCHLMYAVRGFELPESPTGTVGSFSDPCHPRIMGINVSYSTNNEPCLSPFCFQWFGHELAHTKCYLINDIAYHNGWTFVDNPAEYTRRIPRYERPLSVRTVFQVPYTHFYEWVLLIHFMERGFDTLPWEIQDDPVPLGDDLKLEITEAFDLISGHARLTDMGTAAVTHFWQLFKGISSQWQTIRAKWHPSH